MHSRKMYKVLTLLFAIGIMICLIIIMLNNQNYDKRNNKIDKINSEYTSSEEKNETVSENVNRNDTELDGINYNTDLKLVDNINQEKREIRLSDDAVIKYITKYELCEHINENVERIEDQMTNLTKDEFIHNYPLYEIESFNESEVVVRYTIDDYCPNHYVIREHEGKIGVYYRSQSVENPLIKVINIDVLTLREEDQNKLKEGIKLDSDKELAQLIEDFSS